jgi:DNA-binding transcriptional MerR regulator
MSVPTFTISQLAKEFDLTTRAIRFYEDMGLLTPERAGLQRVYSARDRARLTLTLRAKRLGLSLTEAKDILDMYDSPRDTVAAAGKIPRRAGRPPGPAGSPTHRVAGQPGGSEGPREKGTGDPGESPESAENPKAGQGNQAGQAPQGRRSQGLKDTTHRQ